MNIKIIIRNIQLYRLGIGKLDSHEEILYTFLLNTLSDLRELHVKNPFSPDSLYFAKTEDEVIFRYDSNSEIIYILSEQVWSFLSSTIYINDMYIKVLLGWWFNLTLNIKSKYIRFNYIAY